MADCCEEAADGLERRTLKILLAINATMFVAEFSAGWVADSTALLGDSLDVLADAFVYGIALAAVGGSIRSKVRAARATGWFQLGLGLAVVVDVIRRLWYGSEPESLLMVGVGVVALIANLTCLLLIAKHRRGGPHMRASWICSTTDVIANVGVVISGVLVLWLNTPIPDLVVGFLIAAVVTWGGMRILRDDG